MVPPDQLIDESENKSYRKRVVCIAYRTGTAASGTVPTSRTMPSNALPRPALTRRLRRLAATPTYLTIGLGVALVGWQTVAGTLPPVAQGIVFAGLLFGTGIPHGALDHLIDRETATRQGKPFSLGWFLARYLLTMIGFGLVWFWVPALSLVVFLLVSAWHFGETDLERVPPTRLWTLTRFVAGGWVLAFLLLTHGPEVTPLLRRIAHDHALTLSVWQNALRYASSLVQCWGLLTVYLFGNAYLTHPVSIDWPRLARLAAVLMLGAALPLVLAFGLYFGGWHALHSFQTTHGYLRQNQPTLLTTGQIWLKSLPFTALALVVLAGAGWWWQQHAPGWDPLPLLFVFLSIITLPHLPVMHGMNSRV